MSEENKAKADEILDEKKPEETEETGDGKKKEKPVKDPFVILRNLCKGTLKLMQPIRARSKDITELNYDYCTLTGKEIFDALDSEMANNVFAITNAQAIALFAATAANCTDDVDERDIKERLSGVDSIKAIQLSKLFYSASSQAGNNNILNDARTRQ